CCIFPCPLTSPHPIHPPETEQGIFEAVLRGELDFESDPLQCPCSRASVLHIPLPSHFPTPHTPTRDGAGHIRGERIRCQTRLLFFISIPHKQAETEQGIFEAVLRGELDFESDPWPSISEDSKDLIRHMCCLDPKKRYSAYDVLCHPWVAKDGVAPDKPLGSAVLSRLKQFTAMNKLKKMALRVIAESMSEEEISGLKETFKMMDTDGSGTITYEELRAGLKRIGSTLNDMEIKELMDAVSYS
ncbi:unnamed protein product, partial [Closterium sp. NIES-53]